MAGVFKFFTALLAKIVGFAKWLLLVFAQIFKDAWNMVTDVVCWVFEQTLSIAASALDAIAIPFNPQTYYAMIPADAANMLGYVGVPQAITLIVGALVVRFLLQTIPFVRWGS
ncbi:DUF2523 family protein [Pseudomonas aeruginosa]|uniref:DUF2523 family protein n=2 Tax=Pseudomonas aeruginosa TaxID=287 RepID=UPI000B8C3263|nr:DUF2523 family protein [Pseudomonas aeruginosa]ASP08230.1 hypothetical protein CGU46_26240 [Pseudomonas aeruginosa]ASP08239.1 hypothetical protein CGU46_26285 [Pseudomonas aeruginosa]ASP08248.1 hypothetical protein CGU46_26330 [Pseudomonas aeruginosa]ASP15989.1 hypothetical protein CGU45_33270 [Pseudomonas aeruginosa]ASP16007.1 hypothetical protein CGU45_33360 [Pseudomonas aeruginosa]